MTLQLVSAIDTQNQQFLADSCNELLVRVINEIIPVRNSAVEAMQQDRAGPKRKRANAMGMDVVGAIHFVGSFLVKRSESPAAIDFVIGSR